MPVDFRVRSYRDTDRATVCALLDALQEAERGMEPNRADWADGARTYADWMFEELTGNDGAAFVAESDSGEVIAMLSCWRAEDASDITVVPEARIHLYVSDLVVLPEWRGQGIAVTLLAEAEKHGNKLGLKQMTIGVLAANEAARRAYAKAGFEDYEMLLRKRL